MSAIAHGLEPVAGRGTAVGLFGGIFVPMAIPFHRWHARSVAKIGHLPGCRHLPLAVVTPGVAPVLEEPGPGQSLGLMPLVGSRFRVGGEKQPQSMVDRWMAWRASLTLPFSTGMSNSNSRRFLPWESSGRLPPFTMRRTSAVMAPTLIPASTVGCTKSCGLCVTMALISRISRISWAHSRSRVDGSFPYPQRTKGADPTTANTIHAKDSASAEDAPGAIPPIASGTLAIVAVRDATGDSHSIQLRSDFFSMPPCPAVSSAPLTPFHPTQASFGWLPGKVFPSRARPHRDKYHTELTHREAPVVVP